MDQKAPNLNQEKILEIENKLLSYKLIMQGMQVNIAELEKSI
jgi:hypothetical protein